MAPPGDTIDLTLSDDDDGPAPQPAAAAAAAKRVRSPSPAGGSDVVLVDDDGAAAEAASKRQRTVPPSTPQAGDDELVVTGEVGEVALRDFPHARPDCMVHPFSRQQPACAANSSSCRQCFCYVCDCRASACAYWGSGSRARDHCNASCSGYWDALRKAARRGNGALVASEHASAEAQLAVHWVTKAKPRGSGGMLSPTQLWARHKARATAAAEAPAEPQPPPAATPPGESKPLVKPAATPTPQPPRPAAIRLPRMPHPAAAAQPMRLAVSLQLPVKVRKHTSVAELKQRLVPAGLYRLPSSGPSFKAEEYGDAVCLDTISYHKYDLRTGKCKQELVKLLPLVPHGGLPAEPSRQLTWRVIVVDSGNAKPFAVGVTADVEWTVRAFRRALRDALAPSAPLLGHEELVLVSHRRSSDSWDWLTDDKAPMLACLSDWAACTLYALRVPKSALATPLSQQGGSNLSDRGMAYRAPARPTMLLVVHEKLAPCEQPAGDDPLAGGLGGGRRHQAVRFGVPQLVVLRHEDHACGGRDGHGAVQQRLADKLAPFCGASLAPPTRALPFKLQRHSCRHPWVDPESPETCGLFSKKAASLFCTQRSPGVALLYAQWGKEPLGVQRVAGFQLDAFAAEPEVEDAAARQALAEMPALLERWTKYKDEMQLLRSLPKKALAALSDCCASYPPDAYRNLAPNSRIGAVRPAAAAVLQILQMPEAAAAASGGEGSGGEGGEAAARPVVGCMSPEQATAVTAAAKAACGKGKDPHVDASRLALLLVDVYLFEAKPGAAAHHTVVVEETCSWEPSDDEAVRSRIDSRLAGPLEPVLNAALLAQPGGFAMLSKVHNIEQETSRSGSLTISKLMDHLLVTGEREAAPQPAGLTVQLHPYQRQSLSFMLEAERAKGGWRRLLWGWLPAPDGDEPQSPAAGAAAAAAAAASLAGGSAATPQGKGLWWNPLLCRLTPNVAPAPSGGFLADSMGLGKTVTTLGLVLSNPAPPEVVSGAADTEGSGLVLSRATLVVCAVSLVGQWCTEAKAKLGGSLSMYPYHGQGRIRDPQRLARNFDIVATTYATLASDYGFTSSPLHQIKWHRVVFDEGHSIKNFGAQHSKACRALEADRRWIVTGTPVCNDVGDLLGQLAALRLQPFATKSFFEGTIKHALAPVSGVSAHTSGACRATLLLYILGSTMVRHTKLQTIAGQSVLHLPEKTEERVPVTLSAAEAAAYMESHSRASALWESARHLSPAAINQRLLQIMSLLLPLRRICSGGRLRQRDLQLPAHLEGLEGLEGPAAAAAELLGAVAGGMASAAQLAVPLDNALVPTDLECPICLDSFEAPVHTPCGHWFCKECILGVLAASSLCPLCRGSVDTASLRAPGAPQEQPSGAESGDEQPGGEGAAALGGGGGGGSGNVEMRDAGAACAAPAPAGEDEVVCESKLKALLRELRAMRAADASSKALVFSQFNSTLDWLKVQLPQAGFGFRTITGSMPLRQRAKAIEAFQSDPPTTVFLLSMRSGAVGINLTAATHVFLLEPCLNPALEEQAIGRAWRMGQTRRVTVKRFFVKGSVEERIMELARIRQGHGSHAAPAGGSAAAAASAAAAPAPAPSAAESRSQRKIGASAMAGALKADRQVLKIQELDLLFKAPELTSSGGGGGAGSSGAGSSAAATAL